MKRSLIIAVTVLLVAGLSQSALAVVEKAPDPIDLAKQPIAEKAASPATKEITPRFPRLARIFGIRRTVVEQAGVRTSTTERSYTGRRLFRRFRIRTQRTTTTTRRVIKEPPVADAL